MLYKYRSLNNFRHFVDIVIRQRLFAAPYFKLNDPMEGLYIQSYGFGAEELSRRLAGEKSRLGICSLSRKPDDPLMWAHYAGGNRGVVIGVEVDTLKYEVREVQYGDLLALTTPPIDLGSVARDILSRKHWVWSYEQEERVFVEGSKFVKVEVREVLLGARMSAQDEYLVTRLIRSVSPAIRVIKSEVPRIA